MGYEDSQKDAARDEKRRVRRWSRSDHGAAKRPISAKRQLPADGASGRVITCCCETPVRVAAHCCGLQHLKCRFE